MATQLSGHLGHFRWCPLFRTKKEGVGKCWCEVAIYAAMAVIGGVTAALEFWGASIAEAVAPKADALHGAHDAGGDIVAVVIALCALFATPETKTKVREYGAYVQVALLALAMAFVAAEVVQKYFSPDTPDALMMVGLGIIASLGGGARFAVHAMRRGEWNKNRRQQGWHVRSDFYYSIGVVVAGALILITGWAWVDIFAAAVIFLILCGLVICALRDALAHG